MRFGKSEWSTWKRGGEKEWLITNGIGGFAASTITGGNTRRYHGLLVASLKAPVQRHLILSQLHETVISDEKTYSLHSFSTGDYTMEGYHHLESFEMDQLPVFNYVIGDMAIKKTITMVHKRNTVAVVYNIRSGSSPLALRITPLVNFRDYHSDSNKNHMRFEQRYGESATKIKPFGMDLEVSLSCSDSTFTPAENCWFENMHYQKEQERGLHDREDHYIPGSFDIKLGPREIKAITFICTIEEDIESYDGQQLIDNEKARILALVKKAGYTDSFANQLVRASDQFISYRQSTGGKTILAGYPWFTDWGRDAMIAFCGLTLCTGRFDDAAQILSTFSEYIKYGLVPNMFPDTGDEPGYNTVDAALWYFEAIGKYVEYTGNIEFVQSKLYPSMRQIIEAFMAGTLHNIHMDKDGLIIAGDENTQLTWMDAKVDNIVFTPRHGKAVEINALWYNALKVFEHMSEKFGLDAGSYGELAQLVKRSFKDVFWNKEGKYLNDVINNDIVDDSVRPNQIFAVSLTYPVIEGIEAEQIVEKVWKELYTAYGLRTLSPSSPKYKGRYIGSRYDRDSAYHQGTVWAWPMGHFISAFAKTFGKQEAYSELTASFFEPFKDHMMDACLGSISEIFDADGPLTPRGCFAQAWSVAEVLRAYVENVI